MTHFGLPGFACAAFVTVVLAQPLDAAIPTQANQTADERAVLSADARVNAPNNRILTRDDLIRMVASGEIRNEVFERTPEDVVITGDVGVVVGRELVFPGAKSEQARMYGHKTLNRRYTNIYVRSADGWRHLARHANIITIARPR